MKVLQPPIKIFGGKNTMYNQILKHFPKSNEYDTYVEPFGGTFSLGLKMYPIPPVQIYNDLDKNVYSLYKVLSTPELFQNFKSRCDLVLYTEDLRNEFKDRLRRDDISMEDRAFYFFYVNRTSYNGIGGFSKNVWIRRNMSKSISDFLSSIDRLPEIHDRLSRVIVTNTDGIELIKKHNTPNVMIYNDPPYEWSTRTSARYDVDMNREDHIRFLDVAINTKAKMLISGYDCELYNVLDRNGYSRINFNVNMVSGKNEKKIKTEIIWKNY